MNELIKKWDLNDQIVEEVCRINKITINENGNLVDRNGCPMLYHDCESVDFADLGIDYGDDEKIIAVYLWGDMCLELNVYDGNPNDYGESINWGNFSNEVLEQVLELLKGL
jgi:hypothetical protein